MCLRLACFFDPAGCQRSRNLESRLRRHRVAPKLVIDTNATAETLGTAVAATNPATSTGVELSVVVPFFSSLTTIIP